LLCIYITFFFHGTQELLLFKKLFLLLHQDGFDTLFQQKVELFCVLCNAIGYHIGRQQSMILFCQQNSKNLCNTKSPTLNAASESDRLWSEQKSIC